MSSQNYLTQAGYKSLKEELEYLRNVERVQIASRIKEARDMGKIDENLAYDSALEQQGFIEGRIAEIEEILSNHILIEEKKSSEREIVELGAIVVIETAGNKHTFQIVGSAEANPQKKMISNESPVGQALLGAKRGEVVVVKTPIVAAEYKIIEIK